MKKQKFVYTMLHMLAAFALVAFVALFWRVSTLKSETSSCDNLDELIEKHDQLESHDVYEFISTSKPPKKELPRHIEKLKETCDTAP